MRALVVLGFASVASVAALAGCSPATGPLTAGAAAGYVQAAAPTADLLPPGRPGGPSAGYGGAFAPCTLIFASDVFDGSIHVLQNQPPYHQVRVLSSPKGYGYGVAATATTVYAGTAADTIDEYAPCGSKVRKTLTGGSHGPPTGIAIDGKGSIYATETGTNKVDVFQNGGPSFTTVTDPLMPTPYYIAIDKPNDVYLQGLGNASQGDIVDKCSSGLKNCTRFATINTGFDYLGAGGIVVDGNQNVIANDTTAAIYVFSPSGKQLDSFDYSLGGVDNYFSGIALNHAQSKIWGADTVLCGASYDYLCGNAMSLKFDSETGKVLGLGPSTPLVQAGRFSSGQTVMAGIALCPPGPRN